MKHESFTFDAAPPYPERVQVAELLAEIEAVIKKHVVLNEDAAAALAVWVLHTYTFELRDAVAYVAIESPEKRCGKTTLISVLAAMAHKPLIASNITVGALFRAIDVCRPTLFIDEADTFLSGNGAMRGIINSGNTWRTAYVLRPARSRQGHPPSRERYGGQGEGAQAAHYDLVKARPHPSPMASQARHKLDAPNELCAPRNVVPRGEGEEGKSEMDARPHHVSYAPPLPSPLPHSVAEREKSTSRGEGEDNIEHRTPNTEHRSGAGAAAERNETGLTKYSCWCPKVISLIGEVPDTIADRSIVVKMSRKLTSEICAPLTELNTTEIRSKCARFALDAGEALARCEKIRGEGLNDRAADTFDPLYAITRQAGSDWERKLHTAALQLTSAARTDNTGVELLLDIMSIFLQWGREKVFSRELVATLREGHGGMKTLALKDSAIEEQGIARMLRSVRHTAKDIQDRQGGEQRV